VSLKAKIKNIITFHSKKLFYFPILSLLFPTTTVLLCKFQHLKELRREELEEIPLVRELLSDMNSEVRLHFTCINSKCICWKEPTYDFPVSSKCITDVNYCRNLALRIPLSATNALFLSIKLHYSKT
jgi:hypothetical protein